MKAEHIEQLAKFYDAAIELTKKFVDQLKRHANKPEGYDAVQMLQLRFNQYDRHDDENDGSAKKVEIALSIPIDYINAGNTFESLVQLVYSVFSVPPLAAYKLKCIEDMEVCNYNSDNTGVVRVELAYVKI